MNTITVTTAILAGCLSGITLSPGSVQAAEGWYENQLLHPSDHQRRTEQRGRVAIYDGLHESIVDAALDTQFERIENMMFVRVAHTTPDGDEWADDDCD
jgi:hypothetical protein